jgi:hypothetical protein
MEFEFSRDSSEKYANNKFHQNPPSESRFFSMRAGRRADMRNQIVAFSIFTNKPKNTVHTQYCAGDKIKKNEMGGACSAYGGGERCVQDFGGET